MKELTFGRYDFYEEGCFDELVWLVIAEEEDRMLLLAKEVWDWMSFSWGTYSPWEDSRPHLLLEILYDKAFTQEERRQILEVTVKTRNGAYSTQSRLSQEHLFLLSCEEVEQYLPKTKDRLGIPTVHAKCQGAFVSDSSIACCWWLRDTGYSPMYNAEVMPNGQIDPEGDEHEEESGVRPAMWIRK